MKKRKISVTVGIPAFNEEQNIQRLLQSILVQKGNTHTLEKIIVVSDASTDRTASFVRQMRHKKIMLIENKKRQGQTHIQNTIFSLATTDVVVLLEADTSIAGRAYFTHMIRPFYHSTSYGMVQGNELPLPAKTFVGKVLEHQFYAFYTLVMKSKKMRNWLASGRGGRAFSKSVYQKLRWPRNVPEDVYALLWCKTKLINTCFAKNAICRYKIPESIADFINATIKIKAGHKALEKYFSTSLLDNVYRRSFFFTMHLSFYLLFTHPMTLLYFLCTKIYILCISSKKFSYIWPATKTTKKLDI